LANRRVSVRREVGTVRKELMPGSLLKRRFFEAPPEHVAPRLLGKILVCKSTTGLTAGRIVEVEVYLGPHNPTPDRAAHSHRGPTPRNEVLFGPAGHAYVYFIYGRYNCMNFSCEKKGLGGGILLRGVEPLAGIKQMAQRRGLPPDASPCDLTGGPGRLCQAMGITREKHNGLDLVDPDSPLQVRDDGFPVTRVLVTRRIGISHAVELPLRFSLPGNSCVSGPKKMDGTHIFLRKSGVAPGRPGHVVPFRLLP
jgi:DNA-3-methyladenine glycosylase